VKGNAVSARTLFERRHVEPASHAALPCSENAAPIKSSEVWEFAHATSAGLHAIGLGALAAAALTNGPGRSSAPTAPDVSKDARVFAGTGVRGLRPSRPIAIERTENIQTYDNK
jgi:hypothetical protein